MSFFGPISPPVLNEVSTPTVRRALHRARTVGNFAFVQGVVQVIGFLSGILLIRRLEQREYAYFTIANTMQGTLNILADIGISIGLVLLALIPFTDFGSVTGVLTFNLISAIPSLLLNLVLSYRGFRRALPVTG